VTSLYASLSATRKPSSKSVESCVGASRKRRKRPVRERIPEHSKAELNDVAIKAQQGDRRAGDQLAEMMRPYVVNIVRQFDRLGDYSRDQQDEIKQCAWVGVWVALEKFDPAENVKFSTLAWWWMRHEMQVWMGHNSRALPLSLRAWKTTKALEEAWDEAHPHKDIYDATEEELAALGVRLPVDKQGKTLGKELMTAKRSSYEIDPDFDAPGFQSAEDDFFEGEDIESLAIDAYLTVEGLMVEGNIDGAEGVAIDFVIKNALPEEVAENMLAAARLRMGL
jgi:RNA polymerase sigma factor (sigma-70 family)